MLVCVILCIDDVLVIGYSLMKPRKSFEKIVSAHLPIHNHVYLMTAWEFVCQKTSYLQYPSGHRIASPCRAPAATAARMWASAFACVGEQFSLQFHICVKENLPFGCEIFDSLSASCEIARLVFPLRKKRILSLSLTYVQTRLHTRTHTHTWPEIHMCASISRCVLLIICCIFFICQPSQSGFSFIMNS